MTIVLVALGIGMLIGYWQIIPNKYSRWTGYLTWFGLFILLLTMGVRIGSDEKILANLGTLGVQAFLLALFSVVFSVIILFLLEHYLISYQKEEQRKVGEKA